MLYIVRDYDNASCFKPKIEATHMVVAAFLIVQARLNESNAASAFKFGDRVTVHARQGVQRPIRLVFELPLA